MWSMAWSRHTLGIESNVPLQFWSFMKYMLYNPRYCTVMILEGLPVNPLYNPTLLFDKLPVQVVKVYSVLQYPI